MAWEKDPPHLQPSKGIFGFAESTGHHGNVVYEISTVDIDTLPDEGGIIYTAWHFDGLIDPMLMMASSRRVDLCSKVNAVQNSILSRIMKWINVQPVQRTLG